MFSLRREIMSTDAVCGAMSTVLKLTMGQQGHIRATLGQQCQWPSISASRNVITNAQPT